MAIHFSECWQLFEMFQLNLFDVALNFNYFMLQHTGLKMTTFFLKLTMWFTIAVSLFHVW